MKLIPLTQGQSAIVDDCDFEDLSQFKWYANWNKDTKSYYAMRSIRLPNGKWTLEHMQRRILELKQGDRNMVDHRNHDTLDNRRDNLRIATPTQSMFNTRKRKDNTTGFRGVILDKTCNRFRARIQIHGKITSIGSFATKQEAYQAYCKSARELAGEFAYLNTDG